MANEIAWSFDSASTLYALVYEGNTIYDVGDDAFEAVGTWNDARVQECDIAMTAAGDLHFADFPVVAAGEYFVQIRQRIGASPDTDDFPLAQGFMVWDGTSEITTADTSADLSVLEGKVDDVQADVSTLLTHEQTVNSVFPVEPEPEKRARIFI